MSFLDKFRTRREQKFSSSHAEYVDLLHRAVSEGDLKTADADRLDETARLLGYDLDRIERDMATIRQEKEYAEIVARIPQLRGAEDKAYQQHKEYAEETARLKAEFEATMKLRTQTEAELKAQYDTDEEAHKGVMDLQQTLSDLRHEHWPLLKFAEQPPKQRLPDTYYPERKAYSEFRHRTIGGELRITAQGVQ